MKEMNYKQKFGYTALGAVIMLVGICVGSIVSPLKAQKDGVFDYIECRMLSVVNEQQPVIILGSGEGGSGVMLYDKEGKEAVMLDASEAKNSVTVYGKERNEAVSIIASEANNRVVIRDTEGEARTALFTSENTSSILIGDKLEKDKTDPKKKIGLFLSTTKRGSFISLRDKKGRTALALAALQNNESEQKSITIYDKSGNIKWIAPE